MYIEREKALTERGDLISLSVIRNYFCWSIDMMGKFKISDHLCKWKEQAMMQLISLNLAFGLKILNLA